MSIVRSRSSSSLALALALGVFVSCRAQSSPPRPASSAKTPTAGGLTLADRLAREAAQRPAAALPAEGVKVSLARAGFALEGWQQVLASPVGASFCMAGHTVHGTGVAACEYPDEESAAQGLASSHATFDRLIPGRQLVVKRTTLLTLAPAPGSADGARETAALQHTFASL